MRALVIAAASAVLLIAGCTASPPVGGDLDVAAVTVVLDLGVGDAVGPAGVPVVPGSGVVGVTVAELFVSSGGVVLAFDVDGNVVEGGGVPVVVSSGSVTLRLPQGTYDFAVAGRDGLANELADGEAVGVVVASDTTIAIELVSFVGDASLSAPQSIVPNQVVDVPLLVHPPGRSDLVVPLSDFTAEFVASTGVVSSSARGVRLVVACEVVTVAASVFDRRGNPPIERGVTLPISSLCDSYAGGIGVDLIPPFLELDAPPATVAVGSTVTLSGTVNDAQSGVASVDVYDGPVHLGAATFDTALTPHAWSFSFTPSAARLHHLTLTAVDGAGNEFRVVASVAAEEAVGPATFAASAGGANDDRASSISALADGGAITAGYFWGTAAFGGTTLTSVGGADVFVAKTNPDGSWAWATRAGGASSDEATGIRTLADGSAIVTGDFWDTATFGTTTLTSNGNTDVFVAKIDSTGNWVWATSAGSTSGDSGGAVSTLADGSAIVTGSFYGTATFGAMVLASAGGADVFVAKIDPDGNWSWATRAGGTVSDAGYGVSTLGDGSAIITGYFRGVATYGESAISSTSAGGWDVFVAKTDPDGNWDWASRAGGTDSDSGFAVSTLTDGSAIVTGHFSGSATFGTTTLTSTGFNDLFVAKIGFTGIWAWASGVGSTSSDSGFGVGTLADGSAIITGDFSGTATFGTTTLTRAGSNDALVAKANADGSWAWATSVGGSSGDRGTAVSTLADGSALVTGYFGGTVTHGTATLTSNGSLDVFVVKIDPAGGW